MVDIDDEPANHPGKVRAVNQKGEVGYFLPETANSKPWQKSTGYKPTPKPDPIPAFSKSTAEKPAPPAEHIEETEETQDSPEATEPAPKKKPGRKPKSS